MRGQQSLVNDVVSRVGDVLFMNQAVIGFLLERCLPFLLKDARRNSGYI
jgi:hypothetical protein